MWTRCLKYAISYILLLKLGRSFSIFQIPIPQTKPHFITKRNMFCPFLPNLEKNYDRTILNNLF